MIYAEFVRVMDVGWTDIFWFGFWALVILGTYTGTVIGYSRVSARVNFIRYVMPSMYKGQLEIAKTEVKRLKKENFRLDQERRDAIDQLKVIKQTLGGI